MRMACYILLFSGLTSCWMLRAYRIRHLELTDHNKLASVTIHHPSLSFHFVQATGQDNYKAITNYLDVVLPLSNTAAFLVIRNDSIIYERYFNGFSANSILPSNSMAKSFTGTLVSIAISEGKIQSTNEPITNYLPQLLQRDSNFSRITIQHLLDMRSGLLFNEGKYDIKDDAVRIGLRPDIKKHILKIKIAEPPGRFKYQSINSQLLGLIVEKATGKRLNQYLEEKIWQPLGMEHDATWNVDSKKRKQVLISAGLNAIPRDFAKLGRLYLDKGYWQGSRILDESWINSIANRDTMDKYGGYKNQWWSRTAYYSFNDSLQAMAFKDSINNVSSVRRVGNSYRVNYRTASYSAIGFLNQSIYVNYEKNIIIVRIGKRWQNSEMSAIQFIHDLGERL